MATDDLSTRSDFYVYALFRENGVPFYVGKGRGRRWEIHEWEARKGAKGHKSNVIRNLLTIRPEIIKVKIHDRLTEVIAHEYEVSLIKAIGRKPIGPLVNLTDGGEGAAGLIVARGRKHTPEHIEKRIAPHRGQKRSLKARANMAESHRGQTISATHREKLAAANRGKKMTPEAIAKTAEAHRGRKRSAETCANISASKRGKPNANRGRKWSAEHLEKRSATRRANNLANRLRKCPSETDSGGAHSL